MFYEKEGMSGSLFVLMPFKRRKENKTIEDTHIEHQVFIIRRRVLNWQPFFFSGLYDDDEYRIMHVQSTHREYNV
jgi:hypothetical protein